MTIYTTGIYPIPMGIGPQTMHIAINTGSVDFQVMVDDTWVTDTTITEDGRYTVETHETQGQFVVVGDSKVSWKT